MVKKDKSEDRKLSKKDVRRQIEGKLSFALSDWRARLSEKKFQKILRKASKALAGDLVTKRKQFKVPEKRSKEELRLLASDR